MTELFANVPIQIKEQAKYWIDLALTQPNALNGAKTINEFRDLCRTQEEKDFVDFYFQLRLELLNNESNND